jgi:hypothetical protein
MFDDFPKKIILKDSTECEFRIAKGDEKDDIIDFFKRVSPEDLWVQRRDYTKDESVDVLLHLIKNTENVYIIACQNDQIIGIGSIFYASYGAKKDIGDMEIVIDESYKQKRVGTWLVLELVALARQLKLEVVKIELMAGKDDAAIISAKRANFIPMATLKNFLKDRNGNLIDQVILIKEIHEEWSDY